MKLEMTHGMAELPLIGDHEKHSGENDLKLFYRDVPPGGL
jgi:hypothetical protein